MVRIISFYNIEKSFSLDFYIGNTDISWFDYLRGITPEDVNFWKPGGNVPFKALTVGAPFLFRLKSPISAIGGIGFFSSFSFFPISLAWEVFGNRNGTETYDKFYKTIRRLRDKDNLLEKNPNVGCIVLTNPVFFKHEDWIPFKFDSGVVQGAGFTTLTPDGKAIWDKISMTLHRYSIANTGDEKNQFQISEPIAQYGDSVLMKVRLGQGAFRVMLTETYNRKCAISGEKTLPVLEAAHIKPFAESGPHSMSNGLLLRSDIHKLFDSGYLTITNELKVEVSKKIKEEFDNGREYYKFHGQTLAVIPKSIDNRPANNYIEWHNNNIFKS